MIISLMSLALLSAPAIPSAAEPLAVENGTRVRVKAELYTDGPRKWRVTQKWIGQVVAVEPDRIRLLPDGATEPVVVRRSDVRSLEVSTGRESRQAAALRAGGTALAISFVLVAATGSLSSSGDLATFGDQVDTARIGLAAVGLVTVASALSGAAHPHDRWRRVEGVRAGLLIQPRRHGVGAALALRF